LRGIWHAPLGQRPKESGPSEAGNPALPELHWPKSGARDL